jgi:hypothetical protein
MHRFFPYQSKQGLQPHSLIKAFLRNNKLEIFFPHYFTIISANETPFNQ